MTYKLQRRLQVKIMSSLNKFSKRKISTLINFKKYFLIFISFFTFITALGIYYSIFNSADSDPKLILFFLLLGLISFLILFFSIINEVVRLFINIKKKNSWLHFTKKNCRCFFCHSYYSRINCSNICSHFF